MSYVRHYLSDRATTKETYKQLLGLVTEARSDCFQAKALNTGRPPSTPVGFSANPWWT